jgi:hypothetical protein
MGGRGALGLGFRPVPAETDRGVDPHVQVAFAAVRSLCSKHRVHSILG